MQFDAIVVGSGMSGGWSAKELSERGLKVLVLERGFNVEPSVHYSDALAPWQHANFNEIPQDEIAAHYPIQHRGVGYAVKSSNRHFWVKDDEHPYSVEPGTDYDWLRGYHLGGRSVTWGRQSYRLSDIDFEANKKESIAIDWPIRYKNIARWYDHVERFAGIAGANEGLEQLPDGIFQPPFALTDAELAFKTGVERSFPGRRVIHARVAHLTEPTEAQTALGRQACQARNICALGCTFKAYFSSLNATLPAALRTGNTTIKTDSLVTSLNHDATTGQITGVNVLDQKTRAGTTYSAKLVFLNASAIDSALILLNSKADAIPNGLANRSDQVGRNLMDHVSAGSVSGRIKGFENLTIFGRRPGGFYIPRYANITEHDKPYQRGFGYQGSSGPINRSLPNQPGIGAEYKNRHRQPGPWYIGFGAFGEILPNPNNRVTLHPTRRDQWGQPQPHFDCRMGKNETLMMNAAREDGIAMLEAARCTDIKATKRDLSLPGNRIHEMGSARMGHDPSSSVLNGWCQAHDVPNLFVTDGSFMTSAGCQNPSLGYMAFSARAAHYAADLLADGAL